MQFTYKSLALVWLILAALFGLSAVGMVAGPWRLLLVLAALAVPTLLRSRARETTTAGGPSHDSAERRDRSLAGPSALDVHRWENEGGAPRMHAGGGIREPARAAR